VTDPISSDLRTALRRLKLSPMLDTLPERLVLARQRKMPYQDFLELILSDEGTRRDQAAAHRRARLAHLDPAMVLDAWDDSTTITYDQQLWSELCTLRFMENASSVLVLGPVGVGKTMMANALGHIACRRKKSVLIFRTERLLKRLKAARLDNSYDQELRHLLRVDLLILDDFGLQPMDVQETQDIYEVVVERHRRASLVVTSNREPQEWLATMGDPLLAQSAVDRLLNSAYELVLEGESFRRRQKPRLESAP
jgi:DNA replication protein DnaC